MALPEDHRIGQFKSIVDTLKSDWQIARPGGLTMSADSVFKVLDSHPHALRLSHPSDDLQTAFAPVEALRNVKQAKTSWRSPMALSKILHFFNPQISPIYDGELVEGKVMTKFQTEWAAFEPSIHVSISWPHTGMIRYLKYMLWCEHLLSINRESVLRTFRDWIEGQTVPHATEALARGLDATAFEMIAIGAAHLQEDAARGSSPP